MHEGQPAVIRDADYALEWVRIGDPVKETVTESIRRHRRGNCPRNVAEDQAQLEDHRQKYQGHAVGELDPSRESEK